MNSLDRLASDIRACRLCAADFAATETRHEPRPVTWFQPGARILIAGQAPGARVHESGRPFTDPSGDRLRDWMGIEKDVFYDQTRIAIVPMAFCFPGYDARGSDLPPPKRCAETWHARVMAALGNVRLSVFVGSYALRWHLGTKASLTDTVRDWQSFLPKAIPLPHPSWRNTAWIRKNPWFETDLLPHLRTSVAGALA